MLRATAASFAFRRQACLCLHPKRLMATRALPNSIKSLVFEKYGEPDAVLKLCEGPALSPPAADQVLLKILAAPINPSDINTIQGKYPITPTLPGVPGHEGVAEVLAVGSQVTKLSPGDWVVPLEGALGTWREAGCFTAAEWHKIPNDIPLSVAATLRINPPSALGMLENFVQLKEGDVVVQNGATSAVGQAVIELCKAKGVKSVNVIRTRPNWDETVTKLKGLGADIVTTEEKLRQELKASGLPAPALGLNCVGGTCASEVAKTLRPGGTLVTYGGMSMQPVSLPTALLIFKDITFKGFWLSGAWAKEAGPTGMASLLDRLVPYVRQGLLHTDTISFSLDEWKDALAEVKKDYRGRKVLLTGSS